MLRKSKLRPIFISEQSGDALDHVVPVGKANEYVEYVNDLMGNDSAADLDPINQLILLEEMDEHEALLLVQDLFHSIKRKS